MTHIVVLGAGLGGIPMTFELREALGSDAQITLVSDSEWFQFVPSNPWVAVNWRKAEDIKIHLPPLMARRNVRFVSTGAEKVLPQENSLVLKDGTRLSYDYLVIATGPALAFDEIEGFGPGGHTQSICHVDHAESTA
ncbi:MAG TPA: FAD/NAD(P)-binding oxidoreductase, partial [Stellaceae bacterium]|nr:FAD/NAD(P)-binding oxidoreductase [Stellaceae bacterium]